MTFRQAREQIERAIAAGLESVGVLVSGQAEELAPIKSGRLKGSITYATAEVTQKVRDKALPGDGVEHDGSKDTVVIGTNVEYAPYVEYGTKHSAAQPYLRRALEVCKDDIPKAFNDAFKANLK